MLGYATLWGPNAPPPNVRLCSVFVGVCVCACVGWCVCLCVRACVCARLCYIVGTKCSPTQHTCVCVCVCFLAFPIHYVDQCPHKDSNTSKC